MEKVVKETKWAILILILVSIALLGTWGVVNVYDYNLVNQSALLALSLIPLSAALASYMKLTKIKKNPSLMVSETDERLVSQKNEAAAQTLKVLQAVLFFLYLGYTFMIPEDVFTSIVWWLALGLFFFSIFAPVMFRHIGKKD
ncbi:MULTISPECIES: hypothetical protein [Pontibacillus]|uniref:DUF2178 domain-containing protein n=1 Tax=Pontibacillus chungwhensis TaxID=265426 RepID=A0ABY8UYT3_9BACI|nr:MULTISPECIES: hypothetical protein [Pontibacillus]MCD5325967.1 hypothetical protein [Pontibacillus sp. HN14]WIF98423.1 hypothetical protein QNI29_01765 [Pontibacillus chungwhensis]